MVSNIDYVVVIPVRYESLRLPGKPLLDIHGKTLLQHVWERARLSNARRVVIATDHELIFKAAVGFGAQVVMTSANHNCGSDRIAECARILAWPDQQLIVNLQGDEPLMPAQCLEQVAALLAGEPGADAATLYWPIEHEEEIIDPNVVKVVMDRNGAALMFSRAVLPFPREFASPAVALAAGFSWYRHLGLYAYRATSLQKFSETAPTSLEKSEHLEQLRTLETGGKIVLEQACLPIPAGVDTTSDLERVRNILSLT
jgi:3-deoxy-manno-octulosonate cytidylyltransferase (CMP-KDO synthetase)